MRKSLFEAIVAAVISTVPESIRSQMANLDVVLEDRPSSDFDPDGAVGDDDEAGELLGLYEGIPLTERWGDLSGSLPDKITLFQGVIEDEAGADEAVPLVVGETLIHELAHFLGFDESEAERLESRWRQRFEKDYRGPFSAAAEDEPKSK